MHELGEVCDCVNWCSFAVGEKLGMLWCVEELTEHIYVDAEMVVAGWYIVLD